MERSVDLMPPGVEKQVLLVSFEGGMKPPPLATVQGWISMLSHHCASRRDSICTMKRLNLCSSTDPERMGKGAHVL